MNDLWPKDLGVNPVKQRAPVAILKEQASILGQRTGNLVTAKVEQFSTVSYQIREFNYYFNIVAPALDNYQYSLFSIRYNIEFYPLTIHPDTAIMREIAPPPKDEEEQEFIQVKSEEEFLATLKKIFQSQKTIQVIDSLLAMLNFDPSQPKIPDDIPF